MGGFLPNKPRLPHASGAGGSWGSGETRNEDIPGWRRGKEIPIPVKRKESSPRYGRESCCIVDHVDLAGSLEGERFVAQEESVIHSWSRPFVLQGHAHTLLILPYFAPVAAGSCPFSNRSAHMEGRQPSLPLGRCQEAAPEATAIPWVGTFLHPASSCPHRRTVPT